MRTVIEDDAVGATNIDCTNMPTIIAQSFGPGAEDEVAVLLQRINDLVTDVQNLGIRLQQEATTREQAFNGLAEEVSSALTYIQQMKLTIDQQIQTLNGMISNLNNYDIQQIVDAIFPVGSFAFEGVAPELATFSRWGQTYQTNPWVWKRTK